MRPHHLLFLVGYPVAIAGIVQLRRILRERDVRWFVAELGATLAIVAGWALRGGRTGAVVVNAAWAVALVVMWAYVSRRRRP